MLLQRRLVFLFLVAIFYLPEEVVSHNGVQFVVQEGKMAMEFVIACHPASWGIYVRYESHKRVDGNYER